MNLTTFNKTLIAIAAKSFVVAIHVLSHFSTKKNEDEAVIEPVVTKAEAISKVNKKDRCPDILKPYLAIAIEDFKQIKGAISNEAITDKESRKRALKSDGLLVTLINEEFCDVMNSIKSAETLLVIVAIIVMTIIYAIALMSAFVSLILEYIFKIFRLIYNYSF